jgi:hypothetical protein
MSFSLVTQAEKMRILNAAKAEFQAEIYKNITKLGHNPDTYDISTWSFDPDASSGEDDPEFQLKRSVTIAVGRLALIDGKIAELS